MKTILVPGWMKSVRYYGEFNSSVDGLDIWKKDFSLADNRSVDCIVAHSMGAVYALAEERVGNENTRYILVNPLLTKRNFISWFWRWIRCAVNRDMKIDPAMSFNNIFSAIKKAIKISKQNVGEIIEKISKDNILVVRGVKDNYFCDQETVRVINQYGIKVVEVEGLGHEWDEKFKDVLDKVI